MSKIPGVANGRTIVTLFDCAYPADLQAEGQAVSWAVVSGACDKCQHLTVCINSDGNTWRPPDTAACMVRKAEILAKMGG